MLAFGVCLAWHFWFDCYCFLVWLFKFCIVVVPILLFLRITNFILYCYSKVYLSFNSCPFHKRGKVSILSQHPPLSVAACSTRASVAHFTSRFHLLWSTEPPGHSPAEWTDPTLYTPLEDSIASVCPSFTFSTKLESSRRKLCPLRALFSPWEILRNCVECLSGWEVDGLSS